MKLRTFISSYLLLLTILFSSISIVSFYLNNSQMSMLKNKSIGQFQTIVSSLDRDIAVLWGREPADFYELVDALVMGYARYYGRHNVSISIRQSHEVQPSEVIFIDNESGYFINIGGHLTEPFGYFLLDYSLNISENIRDMRNIQNTLLLSAIIFSAVAAVGLYLILSSIFKPLTVVAKASREIANGQFNERIPMYDEKSKNELAQVALDFNKMADRIEQQIAFLEEEAVNKQQFVDNFAHEMRTPLTSIYGNAEYLQKAVLEEGELVELSGQIMNKASYMKEIANSLLQLAMLRDYEPDMQEIFISPLFDDIAQTVKAKIVCKSDVETIIGQEDLIKCLLLNLCQNAVNAGSTEIIMEASAISLSVVDNGCGIPSDKLSKVTEPFYRVDKARNRKHGGVGLGLTLCKQIADVHKAKFHIESAPGKGTSVKITFTSP